MHEGLAIGGAAQPLEDVERLARGGQGLLVASALAHDAREDGEPGGAHGRRVAHEGDTLDNEGASQLYLAAILRPHNLERAERAAHGLALVRDAPPMRTAGLAIFSRIVRERGRHEEALTAAREALDILERLGGTTDGETLVHVALAEALHACGHEAEARVEIDTTRQALLARGDAGQRGLAQDVPGRGSASTPTPSRTPPRGRLRPRCQQGQRHGPREHKPATRGRTRRRTPCAPRRRGGRRRSTSRWVEAGSAWRTPDAVPTSAQTTSQRHTPSEARGSDCILQQCPHAQSDTAAPSTDATSCTTVGVDAARWPT